jgi:hypothetical protein
MGYPPNIAARHDGIEIERVQELDQPLQNLQLAGRTRDDDSQQG